MKKVVFAAVVATALAGPALASGDSANCPTCVRFDDGGSALEMTDYVMSCQQAAGMVARNHWQVVPGKPVNWKRAFAVQAFGKPDDPRILVRVNCLK